MAKSRNRNPRQVFKLSQHLPMQRINVAADCLRASRAIDVHHGTQCVLHNLCDLGNGNCERILWIVAKEVDTSFRQHRTR